MSIAIISHATDTHAHSAVWALEQVGFQADLLYWADFPQVMTGTYGGTEGRFQFQSPHLRQTNYKTIWNRRAISSHPHDNLHSSDKAFALKSCNGFLRSFGDQVDAGVWINPWHLAERSERKISQFNDALSAGFRIPETIVSNDPECVREFVESRLECIIKSTIPMRWDGPGYYVSVLTSSIDVDQLTEDLAISACPMIYQERISKLCEYRVVVFGSHVVCVEIDSQASEASELDWRRVDYRTLSLRPVDLSEDVIAKIRRYMAISGLVHGSFDLIRAPDGEIYFIEINQQGQYIWMEEVVPDLHLLDMTQQFLRSEDHRNFVYSTSCDPVRYAEYLSSGRGEEDFARAHKDHVPDMSPGSVKESGPVTEERMALELR